jgi:hypothetical protein
MIKDEILPSPCGNRRVRMTAGTVRQEAGFWHSLGDLGPPLRPISDDKGYRATEGQAVYWAGLGIIPPHLPSSPPEGRGMTKDEILRKLRMTA